MTYLLALLAAVAGGAAGATAGVIVAGMLAAVLGISSFEGASGYFAVFIGGPIGGLIGMILGAVLVLRRRGHHGFGAISGRLATVLVGVALVAAAAIGILYLSQDILNPNGGAPQLAFEIRLPTGAAAPDARSIELHTSKNRMPALILTDAARNDGGRAVIAGLVEMYYRTSQRTLVMTMPDKTDVLFGIKLGATPKHSREYGEWQRADYMAAPGEDRPRRATAADNYEIRYRADWPGGN